MNLLPSRRAFLSASAVLAAGALSPAAWAQPGTIKFVLPNATGSGVDAMTRAAAPALGKVLGASVVVENQPGAGGVVGLQTLARSPTDGSVLSVVSNNVVILPSVLKSLPFSMPDDFTPIAIVGQTPMVLVANPHKITAANAREFFALLKGSPSTFNFGSGGNGTILHLATEMVLDAGGVKAKHIPYRGVGPMVTDLIGGQVDFGTAALSSVQPHIKSGALRALGVLTTERSQAAPEIPTLAEQGLANFSVEAWLAIIGPKGMSSSAVKKVHDAVVAAFDDPAIKDVMAKQGNSIQVGSSEQAVATFRSELAKYAALVKKVGLEPQ
ncbi:MAG: tripartite tricarboxylate transporter substrate-binding protein [Ottowia sp.]|uniref:Bug family tripartite tricarboxylate transporter substrate binding protein n=1 Tax=Ottowia sp. TaxID=1898956 RepID=UPI003C731ACE